MADESSPNKRIKLDFLGTFEVAVGEGDSTKVFTVHHDVLTQRSTFFKAARSDRWTSHSKGIPTKLDDHDADTFQHYLHCVYKDCMPPLPHADATDNFTKLVKLYILADKVRDQRTANMVIDEVIGFSDTRDEVPEASVLSLVYEGMPSGSPLRKLMVDIYTHEAPSHLEKHAEQLPVAMLVEVAREHAKVMKARAVERRITREKKCRHHHQHGSDESECDDYV